MEPSPHAPGLSVREAARCAPPPVPRPLAPAPRAPLHLRHEARLEGAARAQLLRGLPVEKQVLVHELQQHESHQLAHVLATDELLVPGRRAAVRPPQGGPQSGPRPAPDPSRAGRCGTPPLLWQNSWFPLCSHRRFGTLGKRFTAGPQFSTSETFLGRPPPRAHSSSSTAWDRCCSHHRVTAGKAKDQRASDHPRTC